MLGYIKAYKPELRIKEYEMYKSVYCSLCKYMGKKYGFITRFTLSYDFTFLCLLKMSLNDKSCDVKKGRCVCNPLKKCTFCTNSDKDIAMPAAASVIMVYYNVIDNVTDEKGLKKLAYKILSLLLKRSHRKAAHDYPEIEKAVAQFINKQQILERAECCDIDAAAEPTSNVLSYIFSICSDNENNKRALKRLGYCLGKFIYLTDALEDYEKDIKEGRYNPFGGCTEAMERAERNIYFCINEAINAFELINFYKLKNILGNIIYMGLEESFKRSKTNERSL